MNIPKPITYFLAISFLIFLSAFFIAGCSRSKEPQYYVLNPIVSPTKQIYHNNSLRIGIDEINIPGYLDKPQLSLFLTANQNKYDETQQWAEELSRNIKRVIRTNLSTFLRGSVVNISPWDIKFKPTHQLQININRFDVTIRGNSILQAEFVIYQNDEPIGKYEISYQHHLKHITPETMVVSMNNHLTQLSREIAIHFSRHPNLKSTNNPRKNS